MVFLTDANSEWIIMKYRVAKCGLAPLLFLGLVSCGINHQELSFDKTVQGPFIPRNQVASHVRNAGFPEHLVETMVNIAFCESSLGAKSFAWGQGRRHTGLFQISDLHHSACGYGGVSLSTFRSKMTAPALNAECAYQVYRNAGFSLNPWDCHTGRR